MFLAEVVVPYEGSTASGVHTSREDAESALIAWAVANLRVHPDSRSFEKVCEIARKQSYELAITEKEVGAPL